MKKVLISLFCLFAVIMGIQADDDSITKDVNVLPEQSREFLQTWFSDIAVSRIKIDRENSIVKEYDVWLTNGIKIEFNSSGEWIEIDGNRTTLPERLLSHDLLEQVQKLYPGIGIVKIENEPGETNVKLSNGKELTFNSLGQLIEIDD